MLNDSKWIGYRLSDIFKGSFIKKNETWYLDKVEKNLPDSLGGIYIRKTKGLEFEQQKKNYKLLESIIDEKSKNLSLPDENDIVFHLRLGDVIRDFKNGEVIATNSFFVLTLKEIQLLLDRIKENESGRNIILFYGSHVKKINQRANDQYLEAVQNLLKKNGFTIIEKNSTNPDDDFIYMANSQKFIKSGGGFSILISDIVKRKGGIVYERPKVKYRRSRGISLYLFFEKRYNYIRQLLGDQRL